MSEPTPPELTLPAPPRRDRGIVWTAVASLLLHAGVLAILLWPPLRDGVEAAPPPAIEVELVPPPEVSSSLPPPSSSEVPSSLEPPSSEAPESSEAPSAEPSAPSSAETSSAEPPSSVPPPSSAEASSAAPSFLEASKAVSEAPSSEAPSASEASASAASQPPPASQASSEPPPTPVSRRIVIPVGPSEEGSAAPSSAPDDGVSALTASTGEAADGAAPAAASTEPDTAALDLGKLHSAKRFYLEAMLNAPSMARAREALKTLPREKRLSQTCNIEAIAQIGSAGRGFAPDVVMADAYAKSMIAGTRYTAPGAIFRSEHKWYSVAFECTLSDDLTSVTAFSYRLGADVTDAVVARLGKKQ